MARSRPPLPALGALLLLASCSFADEALWAPLSGESAQSSAATPASVASTGTASQNSATQASSTTAGGAAETALATGGDPAALRSDLQKLQSDVAAHSRDFAELRQQATASQSGNQSGAALARLSNLSSWAKSDAALGNYLVQAARAAQGQPGLDAASGRQLGEIEAEARKLDQQASQLAKQVESETASRKAAAARAARRPPAATQAAAAAPAAPATAAEEDDRRALVTIHFDRPDVAYQQQLYGAVNEALQRRPDLALDIVAVSPPGQGAAAAAAAKRNVASVVDSLVQMGLPPDRLRLSARTMADAKDEQVRIYPR